MVTEITGSESFIHIDFAGQRWVMLTQGVQDIDVDDAIDVYIDPRHIMVFDTDGAAVTPTLQQAA
jgi:glycerol transport system ATP-binding protein